MKRTHWILAAVSLLALFVVPAAEAGDSPGDVIDRIQEGYRQGSVEKMLRQYAGDATFEDVNQRHTFTGLEQIRAMLTRIVGMHLTMGLEESRRVVSGDTVVVEYTYTGQLNGAALGKVAGKEGCPDLRYDLPVTSWFQVKKGRITRQKNFIDLATFLDLRQQMLAAGVDVQDHGSGS